MKKVTEKQEKRVFDYTTHHKMPKVRFRRRKQAYKGIVRPMEKGQKLNFHNTEFYNVKSIKK